MKTFLTCFVLLCCIIGNAQNPCNPDNKNLDYSNFPSDTTIVLKNGTRLTFNRCEYFDLRDCIDVKEISTPEDLKAEGLTTQDNRGNVLLSCGMFRLKIDEKECGTSCLKVPVLVSIPMLPQCLASTEPPGLYTANSKGIWESSTDKSEVKQKNGTAYFQFYMTCGGGKNCDRRMKTKKVKLKTKTFERMELAEVSMRCPLVYNIYTPKHRKNVIKLKLPCYNPDSIMIRTTLIDQQGTSKIIEKPLSQLTTNYKKTKCKVISEKIMKRVFGIFIRRERNIYKKYFVD